MITIAYQSGPHDGFLAFAQAMKAADPTIKVYSSVYHSTALSLLGSSPYYDGITYHPYVQTTNTPDSTPQLQICNMFVDGPKDLVESIREQSITLAQYAGSRAKDMHIILSEYGTAIRGRTDQPNRWLASGLFQGITLSSFIEMGLPLAMRHSAIDFDPTMPLPDGAVGVPDTGIIGHNPMFFPTASSLAMKLLAEAHGLHLLNTTIVDNPIVSGTSREALHVTASFDYNSDRVYIFIINTDLVNSVPVVIDHPFYTNAGTATVKTLNSLNCYDTQTVNITEQVIPVGANSFSFPSPGVPAHSMTLITLTKAGDQQVAAETQRYSFENDTIGSLPAGFTSSGP
ncbi:MAG: hypothetical protein L0Y56_20360, partial [Nitrospira sp.]|nr:hypothetical protein [Nitrospira sp.]